jgi:hypothetical protein
MRHWILATSAGALLAVAGAASAQDTTAPAAPPASAPGAAAPTAQPQTTTPSPSAEATSFTDADLKAFARAAIAANKIQQDAAVPATEKQPKMLAAVQAQGLDPDKFNQIAQASQTDPALLKRIQTVAAADPANAAAAAQPAPASPAAPAPAQPAPAPSAPTP